MTKELLIRDLTLRDGQQSLFATRLSQEQINRVLPFYKNAQFYAMEVWGGAVPDSVMRYLKENPWDRLEQIKKQIGDKSLLTALSRGRNLFGYAPYPDSIIDGFCKNAIQSGLNIMRIFDALNDVNNVKSTIQSVKKYGGIADCAICYTVDPQFSSSQKIKAFFKGHTLPKNVFSDTYFIDKVKQLEDAGADMITLKDMAGLITPSRAGKLIQKIKDHIQIPLDFHTHCTPGYGLSSVFMAILNGADIVDTNIWYFAGGSAAPAIELVWLFCKKAGIGIQVDMDALSNINNELYRDRKELASFDMADRFPILFDYNNIPDEIDHLMGQAVEAARNDKDLDLLHICRKIEDYYQFPQPNSVVRDAEIPGGMYSNMMAQLKAVHAEDILPDAMKLIPKVRLDAGLPPLVTPTSQIVGAQSVSCALSLHKGKEMYSVVSKNFENLVKGEYGLTPVSISKKFRAQITGCPDEKAYNVDEYTSPQNEILSEFDNVQLVQNEKEQLLLDLFPNVAKDYLMDVRRKEWNDKQEKMANQKKQAIEQAQEMASKLEFDGPIVTAPLPGKILSVLIKEGDHVTTGQTLLTIEAMKMENDIRSEINGTVKKVLVKNNEFVNGDKILIQMCKD